MASAASSVNVSKADGNNSASYHRKSLLWLVAVVAGLSVGLLVLSQTLAATADEGFHLLAAHLISVGKRPYLDFVFPQTPLNVYLNSGWMRIFGESWHSAHVLAVLETTGAIFLTAEFALSRFPVRSWRLPGAIAVALLVGLNVLVIDFGTIAQAYAACLLFTVGAFRLTVASIERKGFLLAALAGLLAGAAAASSLLTASACWVLVVWLFLYNRMGSRIGKSCTFIAGAAIPFVPVLWLFAHGPQQVWFNVIRYHLVYRLASWPGATGHDLEVLTSWINASQDLFFIFLAIAGLLFLMTKREWEPARRGEFYLCLGLAVAMGVQNAFAHPTFRQYFVVVVPFVAMLANLGLYSIVSRFGFAEKPIRPLLILAVLLCLQAGRSVYDEKHLFDWHGYERIAKKIEETTPPGATLLADEQVYFLTHRLPPSGMEHANSHKLEFSPALNALFHILPRAELDRQIKAGRFSTIQMCDEEDRIDDLALEEMYEQKADYPSEDDPLCSVFWGLKTKIDESEDSGQ